jgi:hypothetical protein
MMMMMISLLLVVLTITKASIIFVDEHGTNSTQCGNSLSTACATLSLAIAAAHDNDTLLLSAGDTFHVDHALIVRLSNVSIDSSATSAAARPTIVASASARAVFVFDASVQSFSVSNVNFALLLFSLYNSVIFCNSSTLESARVENVTMTLTTGAMVVPAASRASRAASLQDKCATSFCALIQIVPDGDLDVTLRGIEFASSHFLNAFDSKLVYIDVNVNRTGTARLDDVSLRNVQAANVVLQFNCGSGAHCHAEFKRVTIESTTVALAEDNPVLVKSAGNSTIAVEFADCLFRNISSRLNADVVHLLLSGVSNVTMSNCSFIDNVGNRLQAIGCVALVAGLEVDDEATTSFTVVDSNFLHYPRDRGYWTGVGTTNVFVSALFDDSCVSGAVAVRGSLFQGGNGALHVRSRFTTCEHGDFNYRTESIAIEDCSFSNNSATDNGVVFARTSCQTGNWTMHVRRSAFLENKATTLLRGSPLGIEIDTDFDVQTGFLAAIDDCTFVGNVGSGRSGAILLTQTSEVAAFARPLTLAVSNCSMADNSVHVGGGAEQIVVDFANVRLSDIALVAANVITDDDQSLASFGPSNFVATNCSFQCAPGRSASVDKEPDPVSNMDSISVECTPCPMSTYNMDGAILLFNASGDSVSDEQFCLDCGVGTRANCTGNTPGVSQGFWARRHANEQSLTFLKCPKHFCCESAEGCALPDTCSGHRQGALCGACAAGFTHAFAMKSACVPESVCTPTRVWLGNAAVVTAALALVLYTLLRASAKSDGLIKVFVAFCNIAQVVLSNSLALAPTPTTDGALSNAISSAMSVFSGIFPQSTTVAAFCPLATMTSFEMLAPLFAPVSLLVLWVVVSLCIVVRHVIKKRVVKRKGEKDRLLDEPLAATESMPTYRIVASLLSLIDFALFIVVGTCVSLLTTVELWPLNGGGGDEDDTPQCRFWQAGDVECSTGTTAFASLLLCAVLITPALIVWRRFANREALSPVREAVFDVYQSPFAPHAQLYNFAIVGRRVAVAFVNAFIGGNELRVLMIRSVLVVACMLHVYFGSPFASKWVNRLDAASLCALLLASMIQWTSADAEHVDAYGVTSNIQGVMLLFCFLALAIAVGWKVIKAMRCRGGKQTEM